MKTYDIEVQRLKSTRLDRGILEIGLDLLVLPRPVREDQGSTSCLRLPVEHARSLLILLKQQLAELDDLGAAELSLRAADPVQPSAW